MQSPRVLFLFIIFCGSLSGYEKLLNAGKALDSIIPTVQNGKAARRQRMTDRENRARSPIKITSRILYKYIRFGHRKLLFVLWISPVE